MKLRTLLHTTLLTLAFNIAAPVASAFNLRTSAQDNKIENIIPSATTTDKNETFPRGKLYAAVAIDYATGKELYAVNANKQRAPASTVKVMTAYLTFKALKEGRLTLDQKIKVSAHAAAIGRKPGVMDIGLSSSKGIQVIKKMTVEEAFLGTIVQSGCDAAIVLSEAVGGSEKNFVKMMNETAKTLGMTHTQFTNPDGLNDPGMYTTVSDMAKLCAATIRDYPEYYPLFNTKTFTFNGRTFKNHNDFMTSYPGADGIKTGYVDASGWNLTASAERNGKRVIVIVFGASTKAQRLHDVQCYAEYAFRKIDDPTLVFEAKDVSDAVAKKEFYTPAVDHMRVQMPRLFITTDQDDPRITPFFPINENKYPIRTLDTLPPSSAPKQKTPIAPPKN